VGAENFISTKLIKSAKKFEHELVGSTTPERVARNYPGAPVLALVEPTKVSRL
jgi:hypothetical protein